ncbi:hypothetical protein [[Clostridium] innocuum]|uniref:hypothetical protein n=1 Tax=Clostridium innocuum TaxID=1522 RepID=UPI001FF46B80|nr:hypothetical protein [[Clostridium] innocuum]UOX49827.1 hypothetical protein K5I27_18375 [[Clostridium] innocuum]
MRKLKKILAILTCALMGFTLAACSSKNKINEDALDAYAKAATNITKMKSAAYDMKLLVDADDMDMHAKVTMDGTYNAEKKLQLALHMDAAVNGIGLDDLASFYMKDDVVYANIMEMEKEYNELDDQLLNKLKLDKETGDPKKNVEKSFEEMTMEEKDGRKVITAVMNKDGLSAAKDYANKSIDDDIFKLGNGIKVTGIREGSYIFTVNNQNQFERIEMKVAASYELDDEDEKKKAVDMTISLVVNLNDINQVNKIDFPSFKDYKKADSRKSEANDLLNELSNENAL